MTIDWLAKLRHGLEVIAFCLAIAAIQVAFLPDQPYQGILTYSLCIGTTVWAVIDVGRHLFPSSRETGWPHGWAGIALVLGANVVGYLLGTAAADRFCDWYACNPGYISSRADLRNSILITALAGIAGAYYFYSRSKSGYLERKMSEVQRHATESRLKLLEAQLEPHMLFNTLANLRALIGVDAQRAQQMLDHMIAYLRATLAASRSTTHTLQAEFDRLRDYLELMAVRMGPRLAYALDLPAELADQPVPTLLLQPLVENSIQHGLEPKVEGGSVTVTARRQGDTIALVVQDTGVGAADSPTDGKGFGLAQVRERLATLYGTAAAIDFVATRAQGGRATIVFPSQT
jgi:hypothetical protein